MVGLFSIISIMCLADYHISSEWLYLLDILDKKHPVWISGFLRMTRMYGTVRMVRTFLPEPMSSFIVTVPACKYAGSCRGQYHHSNSFLYYINTGVHFVFEYVSHSAWIIQSRRLHEGHDIEIYADCVISLSFPALIQLSAIYNVDCVLSVPCAWISVALLCLQAHWACWFTAFWNIHWSAHLLFQQVQASMVISTTKIFLLHKRPNTSMRCL